MDKWPAKWERICYPDETFTHGREYSYKNSGQMSTPLDHSTVSKLICAEDL